MTKEFLGRGWKFPVGIDPITGSIAMSEYEQDIDEAIEIIIFTAKGERVMRPDFGCGVHDRVFQTMSTAEMGLFQTDVRESLIRYEPRVDVLDVSVSPEKGRDGKLCIAVKYRVRETNNEFNRVYHFYLTEGNA